MEKAYLLERSRSKLKNIRKQSKAKDTASHLLAHTIWPSESTLSLDLATTAEMNIL